MSKAVISMGGSIVAPESPELEYIRALGKLLKRLSEKHELYIVVGGGALARKYINLARQLGSSEVILDEIGIAATRLNARLLIAALDDSANPEPVMDYDEAADSAEVYPVVVMGGTKPGHTTDAVAVTLAEKIGADIFINATSVNGVYTADPNTDPSAKMIDRLSPDRLIELTVQDEYKAGPHIVIDPMAARIIKRSKITTYVLDGRNLKTLENAINGEPFEGSIIVE